MDRPKYDFATAEKMWKNIRSAGKPISFFVKKYGVSQTTISTWLSRYFAERSGRSYKYKDSKK